MRSGFTPGSPWMMIRESGTTEFTREERTQLADLLERLVSSIDHAVSTLEAPAEPLPAEPTGDPSG